MKRRKFIAASAIGALASSTTLQANTKTLSNMAEQEILELRVYTMNFGKSGPFQPYVKDTLVPALKRAGVKKVIAFREMGMSQPSKMYLLLAYASFDHMLKAQNKLDQDNVFKKASAAYRKISSANKVYTRYNTYLMQAFSGMPALKEPEASRKLFELRIYEGHNDDAVSRKVGMFNDEELPVFLETGLDPVFFGNLIAGPEMPALVYMIAFDSMEARDANWKKFVDHPEWNRMKVLPKYADSVSNIIRVFLEEVEL
ncbi:MAG: NIPSNAP family protein [Saprospiraceae bacterium]|nr:NIPSNAP family protein [Saprospiraceae bacterium]